MSDPWLLMCKDRPCVNCGRDDGTIVPAHSNRQTHGKGMGIKAAPDTVIPLCRRCHAEFDMHMEREAAVKFWLTNWVIHIRSLIAAGLVAPVGKSMRERKPERLAKVLPRTEYRR